MFRNFTCALAGAVIEHSEATLLSSFLFHTPTSSGRRVSAYVLARLSVFMEFLNFFVKTLDRRYFSDEKSNSSDGDSSGCINGAVGVNGLRGR